jgi:hypothetical protein
MWKQAQKDPRIWRRLIALDIVLGFVLLVTLWPDGGIWRWIGILAFITNMVIAALYFTRRLPVPY